MRGVWAEGAPFPSVPPGTPAAAGRTRNTEVCFSREDGPEAGGREPLEWGPPLPGWEQAGTMALRLLADFCRSSGINASAFALCPSDRSQKL